MVEYVQALPRGPAAAHSSGHTEHERFSLGHPRHRGLLRLCSHACRVVTSVDDSTGAFLTDSAGISSKKLQVIRNGVDIRRFAAAVGDRAALGLGGGPVVGVVARLHPVKGHAVLLRAFAGVKANFPGAELLIVGDGEERKNLVALAAELRLDDSIVFLGSRRDVPELLAAMDVVVLPSLEEGLPLSLLEAMAAAKPIVATDVGSVSTVIKNNETGMLVAPNDKQALSEAIIRILSDASLQRTLSTAAQQLVKRRYLLDHTAEAYARIYDSLCQ